MRKRIIGFVILCMLCYGSAVAAERPVFEAPDRTVLKAWELLLENRLADARTAFEGIEKKDTRAWEGLYRTGVLLHDDKLKLDAVIGALGCNKDNPAFDYYFGRLRELEYIDPVRVRGLIIRLKDDPDVKINYKHSLSDWYARYLMNVEKKPDEARALFAVCGALNRYDLVASGIEENPVHYVRQALARMKAGERVENVTVDPPTTPDGGLILGAYNERDKEYALAVTSFEAAEAFEGVMSINAPGTARVFLNGYQIYSSFYEEKYPRYRQWRTRFRKGRNFVTVVARLRSAGELKLYVMNEDFMFPPEIRPTDAKNVEVPEIVTGKGRLFARPTDQPYSGYFTGDDPVAVILRLDVMRADRLVEEGQAEIDGLVGRYPESALVRNLLGDWYEFRSGLGVDDSGRMLKLAREAYRKAAGVLAENVDARLWEAEYLLKNEQEKKALAILRELKKEYPLNIDVSNRLMRYFRDKEWDAEYRATLFELAERAPNIYLGRLAEYYLERKDYPSAAKYFGEVAGVYPDYAREKLAEIRLAEGDTVPAFRLYAEARELSPLDLDAYRRGWQAAANYEQYELAFEILNDAIGRFPWRHSLLDVKAGLFLRRAADGDIERAVDTLRKRIGLKFDLKACLKLRRLEGRKMLCDEYPEAVSQERFAHVVKDDHPRASLAILLRDETTWYMEDFSSVTMLHRAYKVFTKDGIGMVSEQTVPADAAGVRILRTVTPDGKEYLPVSLKKVRDGRAASMPKVEENAIIETRAQYDRDFAREIEPGDLIATRQFGMHDIPIVHDTFRIALPAGCGIRWEIENAEIEPAIEDWEDWKVYTWKMSDLPGRKREEFGPRPSALFPTLRVYRAGVKKFRDSETRYERKDDLYTDEKVVSETHRVLDGIENVEDRVRAIFKYVRDNFEEGGDAVSVRDAFATGLASGALRKSMIRAMLEVADIEYELVAQSGGKPDYFDAEDWEGFYFGTEFIRIRTGYQTEIWLDFFGRPRLTPFAPVRGDMWSSIGLARYKKGYGLELFRERSNNMLGFWVDYRSSLDADGNADAMALVYTSDMVGAGMRFGLKDPQNRTQQYYGLGQMLLGRVEFNRAVSEKELERIPALVDNVDEPCFLRFAGKISRYAKKTGGVMSFIPIPERQRSAAFAQLISDKEKRETDFYLRNEIFASANSLRLQYTIPEGWMFTGVPRDRRVFTKYGIYLLNYHVAGRELVVTRSFFFPKLYVKRADYVAFTQIVEDLMKSELLPVEYAKIPEDYAGYAFDFLDGDFE